MTYPPCCTVHHYMYASPVKIYICTLGKSTPCERHSSRLLRVYIYIQSFIFPEPSSDVWSRATFDSQQNGLFARLWDKECPRYLCHDVDSLTKPMIRDMDWHGPSGCSITKRRIQSFEFIIKSVKGFMVLAKKKFGVFLSIIPLWNANCRVSRIRTKLFVSSRGL